MKFSERSIPPQKFHSCSRITIGCTGVKVKIEAPICDDVNAAILPLCACFQGHHMLAVAVLKRSAAVPRCDRLKRKKMEAPKLSVSPRLVDSQYWGSQVPSEESRIRPS